MDQLSIVGLNICKVQDRKLGVKAYISNESCAYGTVMSVVVF